MKGRSKLLLLGVIFLSGCISTPQPEIRLHASVPFEATDQVSVEVFANRGWQDSGLQVGEGDRVFLDARGSWSGGTGWEGGPAGNVGPDIGRVFPAEPAATALIGRVGDWVFPVGAQATETARRSGALSLRMNDPTTWDNSGSVAVSIHVRHADAGPAPGRSPPPSAGRSPATAAAGRTALPSSAALSGLTLILVKTPEYRGYEQRVSERMRGAIAQYVVSPITGSFKSVESALSIDQAAQSGGDLIGLLNVDSHYEKGFPVGEGWAEATLSVFDGSGRKITILKGRATTAGFVTPDLYDSVREAGNRLVAALAQSADLLVAAHQAPAPSPAAPGPEPRRTQRAESFPTLSVDVSFPRATENPDDVAVVVGNADYSKLGKDIPNVRPAYADAEGFKRYAIQALGIREGNIIDLRDATGSQLIRVFGSERHHQGQLHDWVRPQRSRVYVYYAGHGAPAGSDGSAYLVPSDADAARIELNGYPLRLLYANLARLPAKSVTVVLEACFSGASQAGSVIAKASPVFIRPKTPAVPKGITVIAAGAADQLASWDQDGNHSLFTTYYLKGNAGAADLKPYGDGDGMVDHRELERYLADTLTYYARRYYGRDQTVLILEGKETAR